MKQFKTLENTIEEITMIELKMYIQAKPILLDNF